jgi:P27 family predicted phage terminase small subunit
MRGRKPLPTALKLASGGRFRFVNRNEPQHPALDEGVPPELAKDPRAAAEWSRLVPTLTRGHVLVTDRAALIGYCVKVGLWQRLEADALDAPPTVKTPNGIIVPNPIIGMSNKAFALMLKAAAELGLTPSSRSRVVVTPAATPAAEDSFAAFQQRRKR